MVENDINELVKIGYSIIDRYEKMSNSSENREEWENWLRENIYSCQILIQQLQKSNQNYEHILFLSKLIGEHHKNAKPPAISFWTKKISAYSQEMRDRPQLN